MDISWHTTDTQRHPLKTGVRVVHTTNISLQTEVMLRCQLAKPQFLSQGLAEALSPQLMVATGLNRPNSEGYLCVRRINPLDEMIELPVGFLVGQYTMLDGVHMLPDKGRCDPREEGYRPAGSAMVAEHLQRLYDQAQPCFSNSIIVIGWPVKCYIRMSRCSVRATTIWERPPWWSTTYL